MKALTNSDVLALVKTTPSYKRWTSKLTDEIFTEAGFEELMDNDYRMLEDFFGLSVRVVLNKIRTANPIIPSVYASLVEEFSTAEGGIIQRINIMPIKPTSPRYRNLKDGDSVDRWTVRKPKTDERFYGKNFDFQSFISLQEINLQQMFLDNTGIFTYVEGITKSFNEAYYIQKFVMMKEMLSMAINSTKSPLKDTQKITVKPIVANDLSTQEEFYRTIQNFGAMMKSIVMSKDYNAKSFEHGMNPSDYVLMVRYNTWNLLLNNLKAPSFMKESFGLPFKVELVDNFGGIEFHYQTEGGALLKPVYSEKTGEEIGFNQTGGYEIGRAHV